MSFSIFRPAGSMDEKKRRFQVIHYVFKPYLVIPFLRLAEKVLSRFIVKSREDIPEELWNQNALLLWDSQDTAFKEWWWTFKGLKDYEDRVSKGEPLTDVETKKYLSDVKQWTEKEKMHWYRIPKMAMRFIQTIYLEDTAYRELINFYLFHLQAGMNRLYNPEIDHHFPLYTCRYDNQIPYFLEWMKAKNVGGYVVIRVGDEDFNIEKFIGAIEGIIKGKAELSIQNKTEREVTFNVKSNKQESNKQGIVTRKEDEGCSEESKSSKTYTSRTKRSNKAKTGSVSSKATKVCRIPSGQNKQRSKA